MRSQGRQRQEALIGKLLRGLEDEDAAAIGDALGRAETGRASAAGSTDSAAERLALSWRDGLIVGADFGRRSGCRQLCSHGERRSASTRLVFLSKQVDQHVAEAV